MAKGCPHGADGTWRALRHRIPLSGGPLRLIDDLGLIRWSHLERLQTLTGPLRAGPSPQQMAREVTVLPDEVPVGAAGRC